MYKKVYSDNFRYKIYEDEHDCNISIPYLNGFHDIFDAERCLSLLLVVVHDLSVWVLLKFIIVVLYYTAH